MDNFDIQQGVSNRIDSDDFISIEGIDESISKLIHQELKDVGILNDSNYIIMDTISLDSLIDIIDEIDLLDTTDKELLHDFILNIQNNSSSEFDSFSKRFFILDSSNDSFKKYNIFKMNFRYFMTHY